MNGSAAERVHGPSLSSPEFYSVADPGERPGGPGPPLFLDQTKARRVEKNFLETCPPPPLPLSKGLDDHSPFLSQALDLALLFTTKTVTIRRLCCHSSQSRQGGGRET